MRYKQKLIAMGDSIEQEISFSLRNALEIFVAGFPIQQDNPWLHECWGWALYVLRRYIGKPYLRQAIAALVNEILRIRRTHIWGEATTACASDPKQFGAWDQNLLTEWHQRYNGRGIMIYWHAEKGAACIYSQLKSCSSSEAAAMIEGVMRHCTEMSLEKQYVDTHGQSFIGFAFCNLPGFRLLPRFKSIKTKKLYRPYTGNPEAYADQALLKLGRALRTIFLCENLHSETLRREIHEGLNVIELWNDVNDFIL